MLAQVYHKTQRSNSALVCVCAKGVDCMTLHPDEGRCRYVSTGMCLEKLFRVVWGATKISVSLISLSLVTL